MNIEKDILELSMNLIKRVKGQLDTFNFKYFLILLGMGGIEKQESLKARRLWGYFEWGMLPIVLWLPFQWYIHVQNKGLNLTDWILSGVIWLAFVLETGLVLRLVKRKWYYLTTNWLDLVVIVLCFPLLWMRILSFDYFRFWVLLVSAALIIPWLTVAFDVLKKNRFGVTLIILTIATTLFGVLFSFFEPSIHNPLEGIWLAWVTITTVGYGDIVPVTVVGRILAVFGMMLGLILISLVTANLSVFLIERSEEKRRRTVREVDQIAKEILDKLAVVEKKIEKLNKKSEV
jgi:voltage-gated potassium channel